MVRYFPGKRRPGDLRIGCDDNKPFIILALGDDFELTLWMTETQIMKFRPITFSNETIKALTTYVDYDFPMIQKTKK